MRIYNYLVDYIYKIVLEVCCNHNNLRTLVTITDGLSTLMLQQKTQYLDRRQWK